MAKRVRGNRSTHRPGGQGPSRQKKASESASDPVVSGATLAAEEPEVVADVSYGEVEVDEVAAAAVAATVSAAPTAPTAPATAESGPRQSGRRARRRSKQRPADLAAHAAAEDTWVREDLRRISIVSVVLLAALGVSWVLFGLVDVLGLY